MPSDEELRRRLRAARELAGLTREELGALLEEDGFGRHDVAAMEREPRNATEPRRVPFTRARKEALARHLGVPVIWFEADDWRQLIATKYVLPPEAYEGLERQQEQISLLNEVRTEIADVRTLLEQSGRVQEGTGKRQGGAGKRGRRR